MREPLVKLSGLPDEAVHTQPEYWRAIEARDKCPRCGVPRPLTRKSDGPIPVYEGTRSILAPVWGITPYLVGRALYEAIREHLPAHWVWRVTPDKYSAPVDPVGVLVRPKYRPLGHCDRHISKRCRACGLFKYWKGMTTYVVRGDLPKHPITMMRDGGFIAERSLAASLQRRFPRKLKAKPFDVRERAPEPIDA